MKPISFTHSWYFCIYVCMYACMFVDLQRCVFVFVCLFSICLQYCVCLRMQLHRSLMRAMLLKERQTHMHRHLETHTHRYLWTHTHNRPIPQSKTMIFAKYPLKTFTCRHIQTQIHIKSTPPPSSPICTHTTQTYPQRTPTAFIQRALCRVLYTQFLLSRPSSQMYL